MKKFFNLAFKYLKIFIPMCILSLAFMAEYRDLKIENTNAIVFIIIVNAIGAFYLWYLVISDNYKNNNHSK